MNTTEKTRKQRGIVAVRADAGDINKVLAALNTDWTAFKAAQDEKDRQRGNVDVLTTEKIDRINTSVSSLQAMVDEMNTKIAAAAISPNGGKVVRDKDYSEAFHSHIRSGDIKASLNKGTASEGGFLAPVEWDRTIIDKLVQVSPMRQVATVFQTSKGGFKKLVNLRGTGSGWVGETAARPETAGPTFGELPYAFGEIYANPAATQTLLDDSEVDLEDWLAGEVETEFAKQEGVAYLTGNGTNKPRGLLTYVTGGTSAAINPLGAIGLKTAASATVLADTEIIDLIYLLPSAFTGNARFAMNRNTQGVVRKFKDLNGNWMWQPSYAAGQPATLAGYPLTEMPDMPDIATAALPIAFGDFKRAYRIIDIMGTRVLRDPYTNKPYVMFYTTKRVGGGVENPEAMKVLKMA